MMQKTVAFVIDDSLKYQRLLLGAIASFKRHNPTGWNVRVYVVEAGKDFENRLLKLGCEVCIAIRTNPLLGQSWFTCSAARCMNLVDAEPNEVVLTLDADGLICSSVDPLVEEFLQSGTDIALLAETDKRGNTPTVREAWFGCPLEEFKDAASWMDAPMLNCGMMIAHGEKANSIGKEALRLVTQYEDRLYLGEQGPINAVMYDRGLKVFPLQPYHHCLFTSEDGLSFPGPPYLDEVFVDGKRLVYRHFGWRGGENYQKALDSLLENR
jgi:hypothetical protein